MAKQVGVKMAEDDVQRTDRVLVVPGEQLGDSSFKSGKGT
jgi:hypothetical protein